MAVHSVLGSMVSTPLRLGRAEAVTSMYLVDAEAAQRLVDYSGLSVLRLPRGRTICNVDFLEYHGSDLGDFKQVAISFMVAKHDSTPASPWSNLRHWAAGRMGGLLHRMPADSEFALAALRQIWGIPGESRDIAVEVEHGCRVGRLGRGAGVELELRVRLGRRIPAWRTMVSTPDGYTHIDGVSRCMQWRMEASGVRGRLGGAELRLGDGQLADELRSLGLPKRALMTTTMDNLAMSFGEPWPVSEGRSAPMPLLAPASEAGPAAPARPQDADLLEAAGIQPPAPVAREADSSASRATGGTGD